MKELFYLSLALIWLACNSNNENVREISAQTESTASFDFPEDWIGEYHGLLEIFNGSDKTMEVDMTLNIGANNEEGFYPWKLKYGEQDERNYGLKKIDTVANHYVIDEFNGIILDAYTMGNHFISHFSVNGSEITSIYKRIENGLEFQIISSSADTVSHSLAIEGDEEYHVGSFPVKVYQKAILKKTLSK